MNLIRVTALACTLLLAGAAPALAQEHLECPECQKAYPAQPKYCTSDGTKLEPRSYSVMGCGQCQRSFDKGEKFCPWDGYELKVQRPAEKACQKCGQVYRGGEVFCSKDGSPLGNSGAPRPAPAEKKTPPKAAPAKPPKTTILPAPPAPPPGEVRRSVDLSFTASSSSTGFLPFSLSRPGIVEVTAEFVGEGPAMIVLHAPGQVKPVAKKEGASPVVLRYEVSRAALRLGRDFEVWVVRNIKDPARGELTVSMPFDPRDIKREKRVAKARTKGEEPKDPAEKEDGEIIEFAMGTTLFRPFTADTLGRYEVEINYPGKAEMLLSIVDAATNKKLAEKNGQSPIRLSFQATPKTRKLNLILSDFSYKKGEPKTKGVLRIVRP